MSVPKSRREQYSDATRAALIDAATRRFATDGFAGTALEDIAADINATRGAVYHHFSNKRALFKAVHESLELAAVAKAAEAVAGAADPWTGGLAALDSFLDECLDPVYGRVVWIEAPVALGWAEWHEAGETYAFGIIEQQLRALVDAGYIEPLPLEPATRIWFSILGAAGTALAQATPQDQPRLRAEYGELVQRMVVGLLRQPAHHGVGQQSAP